MFLKYLIFLFFSFMLNYCIWLFSFIGKIKKKKNKKVMYLLELCCFLMIGIFINFLLVLLKGSGYLECCLLLDCFGWSFVIKD